MGGGKVVPRGLVKSVPQILGLFAKSLSEQERESWHVGRLQEWERGDMAVLGG